MNKFIIILTIGLLLMYAIGFGDSGSDTPVSVGTILETQTVSHYLYLRVRVDGREFWISTLAKYVPENTLPGDTIEYSGGMLIQGFNSIAMSKSFDTMLLVSKIKVVRQQ